MLFLLVQSCVSPTTLESDCHALCSRTADACQTFDVVACVEHCETLDPAGVESYDRCTQCYVDILCDNSRYAQLCHTQCTED
jgi:hypothetical protein